VYSYRQQEFIETQGFSGTGNLAVLRTIFQMVGPFGGIDIAEDRDWGRRATRLGHSIRYVSDMIVFHPARGSFRDLQTKWDRHISHDFEEYNGRFVGRLLWLIRALAVAGSPIFELERIITSDRLKGGSSRWLAAVGLVGVRLYRSRQMLKLLLPGANTTAASAWNRGNERSQG
jgi:GT2 family glycosyltransferase